MSKASLIQQLNVIKNWYSLYSCQAKKEGWHG